MYDQNSALIAFALFAAILLAVEAGFRIGRRDQATVTDAIKSQVNAIQAAVLGILALLLGFTFSLALQRYDHRSAAVVDEANAIGTVYLRAQLLPADAREPVAALVGSYLDARVRAAGVNLADPAQRAPVLQQTDNLTDQLWSQARKAAGQDTRSVATGLFIQSLNDMIDSRGRREAALDRHVPEAVLILLFATFLMAGAILGYASGVVRNRVALPTVIMVALVVLMVFLIIDLDRPRRGIIQVSQKSLEALQQSIVQSQTRVAPKPGRSADTKYIN